MASDRERITLHSSRPVPQDATVSARTDPQQQLSISLIVRRKKPLNLEQLKGRQLSEEEFTREYGAAPEDFERIRTFAKKHNVTVDEEASSLARRTIVLRGSVAELEKAFGVELHDYQTGKGHRYHVPHGQISIPGTHAELRDIVEIVLGLDARPLAKPHFRFFDQAEASAASEESFTPDQVAEFYNFPSDVDGSGQAIALIELGGGYTDTDLKNYFQQLGIGAPTVTSVSVDGAKNSPGDPNGADGEVALDIEIAGAIAPGAQIVVYFAPNTDQGFLDALTTAIHDQTYKPSTVSISWGAPESSWTNQTMQAFDDACQSAAALGVSVFAASGDSGSTDGVSDGSDHVDFPASSPHVVACGGTQLTTQNGSIESEVVWNDLAEGGGATGGGVSAFFQTPTWQANISVPPSSSGGRGVPDVAGDAAPSSGYQILVDGQQEVVGGTSAVAPLWAALAALLNQKLGRNLGWLNPVLYQHPEAFQDISQGNNGDFTAASGWDPCTGLGSPDGERLVTALSNASGQAAA